ncbi:hypothetical protein LTR84_009738 [Exophiala bonariae]|uniref:Fungal N-terminal domain-containing protein n=1 Tax=Exophiala bonariae TaxID=1690606 RepID=A0AAV9NJ95_9EURO|nr:hypothetical protein LTR84_009738 [Exophiala bonariae]
MDFGCGDVLAGIRLAHTIYQISCVYENRADVRYRNFVSEIQGFRELLKKLLKSLNDAAQRYNDGGLLQRAAYDPLSEDFDAERRQMIGNFNDTLEECQTLLNNNKKLLSKPNNFLDNVMWNLNQQDQKIDDLRKRIHLHSTKIKLVIDRLSINLLTDIDSKVDDLLDISERNINLSKDIQIELRKFYTSWLGVLAGHEPLNALGPEDTHVASAQIREKFEKTLGVNAPASMITNDIPLKEGFDVMLVHFEQSSEGTDQTPEKYLILLKTRWMLSQIKSSRGFQSACAGYYYKRAIGQVEQAVLLRVKGMEIIAYDDETLASLPEHAFMIWEPPKQEENPHLDPTVVRANEQEVIRLQLASTGTPDAVTIFRQSFNSFRIVMETTTQEGKSVILPQTVYTHEDRLIPRYALPTMKKECFEIAIFSRNEETLYRFNSMEDLFAFQTALTGYDVSHSQVKITCQFSKGSASALDCTGQIQLWQDPITVSKLPEAISEGSPIDSFSTNSPRSRESSFVESIGPTTTISRVGNGWEADNIKFSGLTIFTQLNDKSSRLRFAIMFIELETSINIDPKKCNCHRDYNKCPYLCLTRNNGDKFPIHVLFTTLDGHDSPDPNSFDLFPFRAPRRSQFKELTVKETAYLLLKFSTLAEKEKFHRELSLRFRIRAKQLSDQLEMMKGFRHRENKPIRTSQVPTGSFSQPRRSVTSGSFSYSSSPPQLEKLKIETGFSGEWKIPIAANDNSETLPQQTASQAVAVELPGNGETATRAFGSSTQRSSNAISEHLPEKEFGTVRSPTQGDLRRASSKQALDDKPINSNSRASTWTIQPGTVHSTAKQSGLSKLKNKIMGF